MPSRKHEHGHGHAIYPPMPLKLEMEEGNINTTWIAFRVIFLRVANVINLAGSG